MTSTAATATPQLPLAQAIELCLLVEVEARWENLRKERAQSPRTRSRTAEDLHKIQKTYEVFRTRLVAFNKKSASAHGTDLLLNYPERLGAWCQKMRDLYRQVEHDLRVPCPLHLLEKAYRCADSLAGRMGKELFRRCLPPVTTQTAVQELDALAQWCEDCRTAQCTNA